MIESVFLPIAAAAIVITVVLTALYRRATVEAEGQAARSARS